jgi:hypothetical protein
MERQACFRGVLVFPAAGLRDPLPTDEHRSETAASDAWDAALPAAAADAKSGRPDVGAEKWVDQAQDVLERALQGWHLLPKAEALAVAGAPDTQDAVPSEAQSFSDAAVGRSEFRALLCSEELEFAAAEPKAQQARWLLEVRPPEPQEASRPAGLAWVVRLPVAQLLLVPQVLASGVEAQEP